MPTSTAEPDVDLRRRILDTTRQLLVTDGYKNLSMRRIARSIGYSATSIYLHFDSKDALFHALIEEGMGRLYDVLREAAETTDGGPVACLRALCEAYVEFGLDNPEYYEVMFMLHPAHMERYPAEKYRRARRNLDVIARVLADGAEQGAFRCEDSRVSASTVWATLHGAVALLIARRLDVRIGQERFVAAMVEQTVRCFAAQPENAADADELIA